MTKIDNFKNWGSVYDYESDDISVTLLGKRGGIIATLVYPGFYAVDFFYFKNKTT